MQGADNKYQGFASFKNACDSIVFGNSSWVNRGLAGTVLYSAYIKEYNG